jgi:hypothetical protein
MTPLTDLQLALLTAATTRPDGSLLPPPDTLAAQISRVRKAAARLISLGLAIEQQVTDHAASWRTADGVLFGVAITDAGREKLAAVQTSTEPAALPKQTKASLVLALLRQAEGASLNELMAATGWLAHTTRAALTGVRQKGHAVVKTGERGAARYRVEEVA